MPTTPDRLPPRLVVGNEALAALAVPARFALLNHLLAAGPQTASQCAAVVEETASNCSWHLRALAKVGLVEPAEQGSAGDARTRPWQAAAVGFDFSGEPGPAAKVAAAALAVMSTQHADELFGRYMARRELLPEEWTEASGASSYALQLTPVELQALIGAVDALIRPYVRPIRSDAPESSAVVHVTLRAFLNPDVYGDPS
ncbi:MAG: helix-turn-helix transcriptional regulator [Geodermatophilaceae bacterium]|nr:helix-turn-helix transcriptional regulator [Geodermatophilaceae bacterium]